MDSTMAEFLIRDDKQSAGYTVRQGPLPRTREESYMPWALTSSGKVVYSRFQKTDSFDWRKPPSKPGLSPYDRVASEKRRALCQSRLGMIALDNLDLSMHAVSRVSGGIRSFLEQCLQQGPKIMSDYQANVGKYAYGLSYMSFGRFSDQVPKGTVATQIIWNDAVSALKAGKPLAGVMNIHDNVPSKLLKTHNGAQGPLTKTYEDWCKVFRAEAPGELFYDDDPASAPNRNKDVSNAPPGRGRAGGKAASPSTEGGMQRLGSPSVGQVQLHKRAVDIYERKAPNYDRMQRDALTVRTKFSAISYYRDLDTRRELFGAGPSGTTGTLLASAMTFGGLRGESLKQYCLAILGYLVGGGCHSMHESLTVMGYHPDLEYNSSSLLKYSQGQAVSDQFPILPQSFRSSPHFAPWRDEHYDIVVLGGVHWLLD
jgi:hypothetical protein